MMKDRNGNNMQPMTKEQASEWLRNHGIALKNDKGHDAVYVMMMAKSDYFGSSIVDDTHLSLYVRDYLDDPDGYPTKAFDHFVMDCRGKGEYIYWEEFL